VKLNGEPVAPSNQINLTVGNHSIQVPFQNGRFEAPLEVLQAGSVGFSIVVGKDRVQIEGIYGGKFTSDEWTLMLADKRFPDDYRRGINRSDIRSSCVLVFDSEYWEGTVLTATRCRSKIKK
jgi:hypothetical protein